MSQPQNLIFPPPKDKPGPLSTWSERVYGYLQQILPAINAQRTVYDDLEISLLTSGRPGQSGNDPTLAVFRGRSKAFQFSGSQYNELFFSKQIRHRYRAGADLWPHLHWASNGTGTAGVQWGIEFWIANVYSTFVEYAATTAIVTPSGIDRYHDLAVFPKFSAPATKESALIVGTVWRDGNVDANTTGQFALSLDFHYEINKLGTPTQIPR